MVQYIKCKMKMLNILIKLFFLIIFFFNLKTYSQLEITNWIEKPAKEKLCNPLIYIDFWATWCAPCISSMPHIQGLEKKFDDKILFIYISNEPENKIKKFMSERNLDFYAANDTGEFNFKHFNINQIPTALIIDPSGKIIWRGKPGELNEKILKKLISKYGHKKGKKHRIILKQTKKSKNHNNFTQIIKQSLKFKKFEFPVPFKYSIQEHQIIYQGSLKDILARLLSVKPYQIQIEGDNMTYWEIIFDIKFLNNQEKIAYSFLETTGHSWKKLEREKEVYELKERKTSSWLNGKLYQYAESPDQTLSIMDDYFLTVDNASPSQLAQIISKKTPWLFTYNGNNNQIYDWNIRIDSLDNLLKNLIEDLDFTIKKKTENFTVYVIRKIRNK